MEALFRSVFQGRPAPWPEGLDADRFLAYTREQGVQPLLHHLLSESGSLAEWPSAIREALQSARRLQTAFDLQTEHELARVLEALAAAGVSPLLMKGTPLSVTHYPAPGLRPRADTDLLIARSDLEPLDSALGTLGYTRAAGVSGDYVTHQCIYSGRITLDVHWKVLNPAMLADLLPLEELRASSVPVPAFGPHARAPGDAHALLLACVHRVAHHFDAARLIWLYDIHLLAQRMDAAAFESFAQRAAEKRVRTLCVDGLQAAQECFATKGFEDIARRLLHVPDAAIEPTAWFLKRDLNRFELLKMDFRHVHGRAKLRLLREHLFPPSGYMLQKYNTTRRPLLPALYARRILSGAWKLLRR